MKNESEVKIMGETTIHIIFSEEEMDKIMKFQDQEGFETVQDAVMAAINSCMKE